MRDDARSGPDRDPAVLARVQARFSQSGPFVRRYVAGKLRRDPVNRALLTLGAAEPFGHVVDIGCGWGQLGIALLEAGVASSVLGLDVSVRHLDRARRAAHGLSFEARIQDLGRLQEIPPADTVLLIDVLYQLETRAQDALLDRAADAAGARLLIRTLDPDRGWRSTLTRALERLGRPIWPNSGRHVNARPADEITRQLRQSGFHVECRPCWRGTPFANILLIARRGATGRGADAGQVGG